jgi:hypothetical protein
MSFGWYLLLPINQIFMSSRIPWCERQNIWHAPSAFWHPSTINQTADGGDNAITLEFGYLLIDTNRFQRKRSWWRSKDLIILKSAIPIAKQLHTYKQLTNHKPRHTNVIKMMFRLAFLSILAVGSNAFMTAPTVPVRSVSSIWSHHYDLRWIFDQLDLQIDNWLVAG